MTMDSTGATAPSVQPKGVNKMGLDMYLENRRFIWTDDRKKLSITGIKGIDSSKVTYITEEVGYWRKANAIHRWFVDNVQEGNDDCKAYYVDTDQLKTLLKLVNRVLKDHSLADELLPTQGGFFFGEIQYDEWYFERLQDTKKMLTELVARVSKEDFTGEIYYQSSW